MGYIWLALIINKNYYYSLDYDENGYINKVTIKDIYKLVDWNYFQSIFCYNSRLIMYGFH